MNNFEIQNCLDSMVILCDTREQDTDRARNRYARFGVPYKRHTLDFGDYTYNFMLPNKTWLYEANTSVKGDVIVERKMNLDELAGCFTRERKRFEAEFERAKENGSKIYLLVENATWENLLNGRYRSRFIPKAFKASILAWSIRYNMQIIFCKAETSGELIKEILYRELKERLERGEYDEKVNAGCN